MGKNGFSLRTMLAVNVCKISRSLLHVIGKGGTSLPGKIARMIDPKLLERTSRGMQVILVTGTNGKTTTCRLLHEAFEGSGWKCLLNRSGANLASGITAEFACGASWNGKPRYDAAVIECDEGALKQVAGEILPKVIVVTNLFRDQLDRYGEVTGTRRQILTGIRKTPKSVLCLNGDCSLTESMSKETVNPVRRFGVSVPAGSAEEGEISDARYCIFCGTRYQYTYHTYAHLGGFFCPECGYRRQEPDTAVTAIEKKGSAGSRIRMRIDEREYETEPALPGIYNLYNAAAAVCGGSAMGLLPCELLAAVSDTKAGFGRMEDFSLEGTKVRMILVKNPAGCDQALDYVTVTKQDYDLVFCLNDKTADGHDVSWIWDVNFEKAVQDEHLKAVYVSGTRAEDMQLRLKYAGLGESRIVLEKNNASLIQLMKESKRPVFVLPNYTAMLSLRKDMVRQTGKEAFWKG